jgi:hypothetical protein
MWYTVYRLNLNLELMKWWSHFGYLHLFLFCFVHMCWRNIPPPSSGGLNQFKVDLPWRWSQYVPLRCQNKSKHYMLQKSNRWPSFDQQCWKNLKTYRFQVNCPHSKHRKPKYSLQRLPCIVVNLIFMFCK